MDNKHGSNTSRDAENEGAPRRGENGEPATPDARGTDPPTERGDAGPALDVAAGSETNGAAGGAKPSAEEPVESSGAAAEVPSFPSDSDAPSTAVTNANATAERNAKEPQREGEGEGEGGGLEQHQDEEDECMCEVPPATTTGTGSTDTVADTAGKGADGGDYGTAAVVTGNVSDMRDCNVDPGHDPASASSSSSSSSAAPSTTSAGEVATQPRGDEGRNETEVCVEHNKREGGKSAQEQCASLSPDEARYAQGQLALLKLYPSVAPLFSMSDAVDDMYYSLEADTEDLESETPQNVEANNLHNKCSLLSSEPQHQSPSLQYYNCPDHYDPQVCRWHKLTLPQRLKMIKTRKAQRLLPFEQQTALFRKPWEMFAFVQSESKKCSLPADYMQVQCGECEVQDPAPPLADIGFFPEITYVSNSVPRPASFKYQHRYQPCNPRHSQRNNTHHLNAIAALKKAIVSMLISLDFQSASTHTLEVFTDTVAQYITRLCTQMRARIDNLESRTPTLMLMNQCLCDMGVGGITALQSYYSRTIQPPSSHTSLTPSPTTTICFPITPLIPNPPTTPNPGTDSQMHSTPPTDISSSNSSTSTTSTSLIQSTLSSCNSTNIGNLT
ncbi:hypothetical protein Pelo_10432 [Pelomyxa schiedti]|nr:hypothetical protein Pelo_10432 [Pelomyxa schiedti]